MEPLLFTGATGAEPAPAPNPWENFWDQVVDFFKNNYWNLLKVLAIIVIGLLVIWLFVVILKKFMRSKQVDPMVIRFTAGIIRFTLLLFLVLIVLATMGIEVSGFTTAVSAAVLAVGMALKENLSNLANGLILVGSKRYRSGDYIFVGSVEGTIKEIGFLFTCLETPDGKQVLMPNSTMVNNQVTNVSAKGTRRINIDLGVAYETDVDQVKEIVIAVMKSNGKVYLDPAPFCRLKTLGDSSINFFCNCWVDKEDYWDVYYYLMENIFNELKRANISIPFQQIEMRQRVDEVIMPVDKSVLPERIEKKRVARKKSFNIDEWEENIALPIPAPKKSAPKKKEAAKKEPAKKSEPKKK